MMKYFWLFLLCFNAAFSSQARITYSKTGGRFGDNLLAYLEAKWLSKREKIPLLYEPFLYSEELALSQKEERFGPRHYGLRKMKVRKASHFDRKSPFLYECPYFPAFKEEQIEGKWWAFEVDWKDPEFRKSCLEMIAPKEKLSLVEIPQGLVSIAVHVREGGGFDTDHTRLWDPLKLPPLPFYEEALAKAIALFPDKQIYCHLFTDAVDVEQLAGELRKNLPSNVVLKYRAQGNHHTLNVLEDFFSLFQFDVLIRPRSNFSVVPSLLRDYAAVFYPAEYRRTGTHIDITQIGVEMNESLYRRL